MYIDGAGVLWLRVLRGRNHHRTQGRSVRFASGEQKNFVPSLLTNFIRNFHLIFSHCLQKSYHTHQKQGISRGWHVPGLPHPTPLIGHSHWNHPAAADVILFWWKRASSKVAATPSITQVLPEPVSWLGINNLILLSILLIQIHTVLWFVYSDKYLDCKI